VPILQVVTPAVLLFATVAQGAMSGIEEPRQVVVRSATEWQMLWRQHGQEPATLPVVDFTESLVVGVFVGSRPTAGYSVEIVAVKTERNRTIVEYRERRPDRDALVLQVITSPFHLVRVPRTESVIEFKRLDP
jgi:PrcB C-terminal